LSASFDGTVIHSVGKTPVPSSMGFLKNKGMCHFFGTALFPTSNSRHTRKHRSTINQNHVFNFTYQALSSMHVIKHRCFESSTMFLIRQFCDNLESRCAIGWIKKHASNGAVFIYLLRIFNTLRLVKMCSRTNLEPSWSWRWKLSLALGCWVQNHFLLPFSQVHLINLQYSLIVKKVIWNKHRTGWSWGIKLTQIVTSKWSPVSDQNSKEVQTGIFWTRSQDWSIDSMIFRNSVEIFTVASLCQISCSQQCI
jgi:hypothetical protein